MDRAVNGQHFARPDQQAFPGPDEIDGHLLEGTVPVNLRRSRHASDQCGHVTLGAPLRELFKSLTSREHHGDDDARQGFAAQQCATHRQCCDDVEPEFTLAE